VPPDHGGVLYDSSAPGERASETDTLRALLALEAEGIRGYDETNSSVDTDEQKYVVYDMDSGPDDLAALLVLLMNNRTTVSGISIVNGLVSPEEGAVLVSQFGVLLNGAGERYPQISAGASKTVAGNNHFPLVWGQQSMVAGLGALWSEDLPASVGWGNRTEIGPNYYLKIFREARRISIAVLILKCVLKSRFNCTIMASGPLTNLAKEIDLLKKLHAFGFINGIYYMGGSTDTEPALAYTVGSMCFDDTGKLNLPGICSEESRAEFNVWVDATAADMVYRSGIPIYPSGKPRMPHLLRLSRRSFSEGGLPGVRSKVLRLHPWRLRYGASSAFATLGSMSQNIEAGTMLSIYPGNGKARSRQEGGRSQRRGSRG